MARLDTEKVDRAGAVVVARGSADGLVTPALLLREGVAGVPDQVGYDENFGLSAGAHDYDGDGLLDLVIGSLGLVSDAYTRAGATYVATGRLSDGSFEAWERWTQDSAGVIGRPESYDGMGFVDG